MTKNIFLNVVVRSKLNTMYSKINVTYFVTPIGWGKKPGKSLKPPGTLMG